MIPMMLRCGTTPAAAQDTIMQSAETFFSTMPNPMDLDQDNAPLSFDHGGIADEFAQLAPPVDHGPYPGWNATPAPRHQMPTLNFNDVSDVDQESEQQLDISSDRMTPDDLQASLEQINHLYHGLPRLKKSLPAAGARFVEGPNPGQWSYDSDTTYFNTFKESNRTAEQQMKHQKIKKKGSMVVKLSFQNRWKQLGPAAIEADLP
ncbi:hypothetical protein EJ04DRAFT_513793 [Polyplosphaeria fusca]|uniref:Uncharacterized protein n=1 Tax=Polyplosphaeria fusca TaxID=682080 RepID=A0A9P4QX17_9PLEO|nr:hypothetical protein EJ04DRAFT_513793 [Polyplosphaeria fusca]